jgi:hypothetical protein
MMIVLPEHKDLEVASPLWKYCLPTSSILVVLVCGWVLGTQLQIPSVIGVLLTSKACLLFQSDLAHVPVWVERQLALVPFFRGGHIILQFEPRDLRTVLWQGLGVLLLGICEVSVVIPTLNEEKYVPKCLGSLKRQNFDGDFETIVVDGGSGDSTVDLARSTADKVIVYKGRPVGDARNFGARLAESRIVAFIDADTIASRNWLSSIKESLSCKGAVGVTGPTLPYEGSGLDVLAYKVATGWLQRFSMLFGLPHVAGFNCAYRREPFLNCGGFEEGRTLSEDLALSLKMRHEGQLVFNKKMVAYTSTRRVRSYGYVRLALFYLLNDAIFALTGRSLYYPPVR